MFRIDMLPADHGDCLWVSYGPDAAPRHVLVDAGTTSTWSRLQPRLAEAVAANGGRLHFELLVVTHVDADHVGGALKLLEEAPAMGVRFGEVWFNGWHHLDNERPPHDDTLGAKQGEALSALIASWDLPWNASFERRAVMVPATGPLPERTFSGLTLTLLSPTFEKLQALKPVWEQEVVRAGLQPGAAYTAFDVEQPSDALGGRVEDLAAVPFAADTTRPNGSSIAFLAEYEGKRVLFGADAHVDVLLASLARGPLQNAEALAIDAFKVPHHGSRRNLDRRLVQAVPAARYLISTNGAQFHHPDPEAIARIAVYGPAAKTLEFNYRTDFNREWASASVRNRFGLAAHYGSEVEGRRVEL
jgi:hypothetical protein